MDKQIFTSVCEGRCLAPSVVLDNEVVGMWLDGLRERLVPPAENLTRDQQIAELEQILDSEF